jgi:hypothetical protein
MYKLYNLLTNEVIDQNEEITPLFVKLEHYQVIIKGKKQEIVAGKPANMLDVMNRENAHTLPKLQEVYI